MGRYGPVRAKNTCVQPENEAQIEVFSMMRAAFFVMM
jgi:hypothetical protein